MTACAYCGTDSSVDAVTGYCATCSWALAKANAHVVDSLLLSMRALAVNVLEQGVAPVDVRAAIEVAISDRAALGIDSKPQMELEARESKLMRRVFSERQVTA